MNRQPETFADVIFVVLFMALVAAMVVMLALAKLGWWVFNLPARVSGWRR